MGETNKANDQQVGGFKDIFKSKENFWATFKQFLKFGIVGVLNTLISLGTYYICVPLGMDKYWASTLGFVISIINAYIWNVKWVFKGNKQGFKKTVPKFFITYISTYILSLVLLFLFVDMAGMNQYLAPIINTCITMFLNFSISKFWTFKK